MGVSKSIAAHYDRGDIASRVFAGLQASGKNLDALTREDLAPVDQFHARGTMATLELLELAAMPEGCNVLDVGGGIGGSARLISAKLKAHVTVLDLSVDFCLAGERLTRQMGQDKQVSFKHGDATDMPFPDAGFDAVWTQHSSMNVADKTALYREAFRVLRPGGKLALHEVMGGFVTPPHFPVPWANQSCTSFLAPATEVNAIIHAAGFTELKWLDVTEPTRAWAQQTRAALEAQVGRPPALGLSTILGAETGHMTMNFIRNLLEDRVTVFCGVFQKAHTL